MRVSKRLIQLNLVKKEQAGYHEYTKSIPKQERKWQLRWNEHPITPNPLDDCSCRSFHGQIRLWKKLLKQWEGKNEKKDEEEEEEGKEEEENCAPSSR